MPKRAFIRTLEINEEWRIRSDRNNCTLQRLTKTEKHPDGVWANEGHLPNVKTCLLKVCDMEIRETGSLREAIEKIEHLENMISKIEEVKINGSKDESTESAGGYDGERGADGTGSAEGVERDCDDHAGQNRQADNRG